MAKPVIFGIGTLGRRLAAAFLGVALSAIVIMSVITQIGTDSDITELSVGQEDALSDAAAAVSEGLYSPTGWQRADLAPVLDLVQHEGSAAAVRDRRGALVAATPGFARFQGRRRFVTSVVVRGRTVGSVTVKFGKGGVGSVVSQFASERLRNDLSAAGLVALIALMVSLLVSRHITLPLERVLGTMRARGAGDRSVRITDTRGTGVIHELVVALNESSDAIDKRDRLQKNLVASIAHELRTPVAILQASHEAMIDGVRAPTTEYLWSLRDEVLRLARMIDDLQRLAAAEAAALQLQLVRQNLAVIVADVVGSQRDSIYAADVNVIRRLSSVWIMCDPDRMREVVVNLLTNALKFTPAGGTVVLETGRTGRGLAKLRVSDTGIGIPSDELPRVTERFFRGQRSSEMATGSGIGLTIVAELVRAQHGILTIHSEPGKGTQATVLIPTTSSSPRTEAQRQQPDSAMVIAAPDRSAEPPRRSQGSAASSSRLWA